MTPERQREVIAEWCGWKQGQCGWWTGPNGEQTPHLPDYLNDLNTTHQAILKIESPNMQLTFGNNLIEVCDRDKPKAVDTFHIVNATAAQRAEALLRTIGKWED